MKIETKKVYYCEFCRKHSLASWSIKVHEEHCTLNPKRSCRMCEDGPITLPIIQKEYGTAVQITGKECPACVLAFCRQNKVIDVTIKGGSELDLWNYKEAAKKYLEEKHRDDPYDY